MVSLAGKADILCRGTRGGLRGGGKGRPALLVVDLSGLRYMDCWTLGVVLRARLDLHEARSRVTLAGPQKVVARVLQLTDADRVFTVYRSVQAVAR